MVSFGAGIYFVRIKLVFLHSVSSLYIEVSPRSIPNVLFSLSFVRSFGFRSVFGLSSSSSNILGLGLVRGFVQLVVRSARVTSLFEVRLV